MAKHLSKKKKKTRKMEISTESTDDDNERILETPEANLNTDSSIPEQTIVIAPEVSITKSVSEEVQTSDININISNAGINVSMGVDNSKKEAKGNTDSFISLPPQITPRTSTTDSSIFENILNRPITSIFTS